MMASPTVQQLPTTGLPIQNVVYRREDLHRRFGGNRYSGIVASVREPAVLLFHTEEPAQQFYRDGFDALGVYWYSGEGTSGDMTWSAANRSVRDHSERGIDLLLFERAQRQGGLWRFANVMHCVGHKTERRRDKVGGERNAIVFALVPIDFISTADDIETNEGTAEILSEPYPEPSLEDGEQSVRVRLQAFYRRSALVRAHAFARAAGLCEACHLPAPFLTGAGQPFLEVHHIDRLADGGPDRVDRVAAVCPNCHRRCHHGVDSGAYNELIRLRIAEQEGLAHGNGSPNST
jgi:5-methylcytosine-specific restriction enzyme A